MDYNLAPQSKAVATLLYGSLMAKETNLMELAQKKINIENKMKKVVDKGLKVIGAVGSLNQPVGLVAQKMSADVSSGMPGQPSQNHLINQGASAVSKWTGALTVPNV